MKTIKFIYGLFFILLLIVSCDKDSSGLSESGSVGVGGSMARFTIVGAYMYTVDNMVLKAYSLSDPKNPKLVSAQNIGWDIETIYPYDGKLFIGSMNAMYVYDLSNPEKPTEKGYARHLRACDPVVAQGNNAYVTVRAGNNCGGILNALLVYDVSQDNDNPKLLTQFELKGPYGLAIKDKRLFVCDGDDGLKVLDISNPMSPALLTKRTGYFFKDCLIYNNILVCMVKNGMVLYDVSDLNNPKLIDEVL